jgi:uncharacterized UBP type Zn finger protein
MKPRPRWRNGTAKPWKSRLRNRPRAPLRRDQMARECTHLAKDLKIVKTDVDVCEDCIKTGDTWVHLRLCTDCGHVGCCDSSKNKHATKHFHRTKHPVIRSIEPGETWTWCYVDEMMGELSRAS